MSHPPPDPDRTLRTVVAATGAATGVATAALAVAAGGSWWAVPLFGLPAFWGAGAAWVIRPADGQQYSWFGSMMMWCLLAAILTTGFVSLVFLGELLDQIRPRPVTGLGPTSVVPAGCFFCCGWPGGLVCLVFVFHTFAKRLFRETHADGEAE